MASGRHCDDRAPPNPRGNLWLTFFRATTVDEGIVDAALGKTVDSSPCRDGFGS